MAGVQTPVVMLPRYSCYSGAEDFITIAMDVTPYVKATLNVWRATLIGSSSPTFGIYFEESTDQIGWSLCAVSPSGHDPGAHTETQYVVTLAKRWFRTRVTLGGDAVATCWCVGFFEERES